MTITRIEVPAEWRRQWPCSRLAGTTFTVTHADNGDLIAIQGAELPEDVEAAELDAVTEAYGEVVR